MADSSALGDAQPIALADHQLGANLFIERDFHPERIATFCYFDKQSIARQARHIGWMAEKITETLATNLAHFMEAKGIKQKALATKSGVGQTTISLYLNPESRIGHDSGKEKSPTLARIHALAEGLGIELWELLRPLTPAQRDLVRSVEAVIAERTATALAPAVSVSAKAEKPVRIRRPRSAPPEKRRKKQL